MLAGDINRNYFDPNNASHMAISFECLTDAGRDGEWAALNVHTNVDDRLNCDSDPLDRFPWIPIDVACTTIRPQAFFPNCWNGKDSYLPGNAHVAYPVGSNNYEGGTCPTGFTRIPSLFMEGLLSCPGGVRMEC